MDRLIYTALSGMQASMNRQRVIASNMANTQTIGFRAEAVSLATNGFSGRFDFAEELGAAQLIHGTFAGETVVAHLSGSNHFAPGDPLAFRVDPSDIQLFDTETGHRLAGEVMPVAVTRKAAPILVKA